MSEEMRARFIEVRRKIICMEFSRLNGQQQKAVMATEGPLLLLAGAGSGKTTVIINRIANLLKFGRASDTSEMPEGVTEHDVELMEQFCLRPTVELAERVFDLCVLDAVSPWRIIAITFTNKAADELKNRLEAMLGSEAQNLWSSTFHSACVRILRRDIERLGIFTSHFAIYDTSDSLSLLKRIIKDMELDEKIFVPRSVLNYISKCKDKMELPDKVVSELEHSKDLRKKQTAQIYLEYMKRMRGANALDFDDLIFWTVKLLTEDTEAREYYQNRFDYVLVDEYQDTNELQYRLVNLLSGGKHNICVVGDDDQGIYRFRGASIENILSFEHQYKDARVIRLEQNYRSTWHILEAANAVIAHNKGRKGKELWTENEHGEPLTLNIAGDETEEARFVVDTILEGRERGMKWSDFAVLYRMNAQSNQLEYAFKRGGVPYRMIGGTKFFDRTEIKDVLSYLCVVYNPEDDLRLLRIINNPPRGIGAKTVETAVQLAANLDKPVYEVIKHSGEYPELQKSAARLMLFVSIIDRLRENMELPLPEFYDILLEASGYVRMLKQKDSQENISRLENVTELKTAMISYMKERDGNGDLAGFLEEVALYADIDQYEQDSDYAVMMTMHSAKGLEFPVVFIVGAEEGIFPGTRAVGEFDELEEERRLCYVALTRARKRLYILAARRRMLFGRTSTNPISRFVTEIPEEHIESPVPVRKTFSFDEGVEFGRGGYIKDGVAESVRNVSANVIAGSGVRFTKPMTSHAVTKGVEVPLQSLKGGDVINHKTFGRGTILAVTPTGTDALLEISFDGSGTRRLMRNFASQYISLITDG